MVMAIRMDEFGGPDVLRWREVDVPGPGPGQARVRHTAIGLNFIDTYHRTGLYPLDLPTGIGSEAAGVVEAVGGGVEDVSPGDRVAYTGRPADAYSEARIIDAGMLVPLPESVSDEQAAAGLLKGLTAWYLVRRSYPVQPGDTVLLHAAAGGVGLLALQWARHLGATVIGVVSTHAKAALARDKGCDHVLQVGPAELASAVRELTGGEGVAAAYDSVGKDTFIASLDSLRRHGVMVSFGNASGPAPAIAPLELAKRGSLYLTRPVLFDFVAERAALLAAADTLFGMIGAGTLEVLVNQRYALRDAAQAHRDLEARRTTGSTVLLP